MLFAQGYDVSYWVIEYYLSGCGGFSLHVWLCFLAAALRCVQDLRDELQNLGCVSSAYSLMNHTTRSEPHVLLD